MAGILFKGATLADGSVADVAVAGNSIAQVGAIDNPGEYDRVVDCSRFLLLPGLVNGHGHAAMTLLRGIGDDLPLLQWLEQEMWPREAMLTGDDVYWGTMLAIAEMLRGGTTVFTDMYFYMDDAARAVAESGMRAVLSLGMVGVSADGGDRFAMSRDFVRTWHRAAGGRINVMLGPHAPYTCPPEYLARVAELARELAVPVQIHLAETAGEVKDSLERYGKTPVAQVEETGLFSVPVVAAHCVHLTDADIDILARHNVGVVHNPGSNLKLGSGIAPVARLLDKGIAVGLGTDGAASNNNLDLVEEMRLAALLQKGSQQDPTLVPARVALDMATAMGARVLFLADEIGEIAPGKKADLILVDLDRPHFAPRTNVLSHFVYSAGAADVYLVMVDGKVLVEGGRLLTIDEERVLYEANHRARRLKGRV